MEAVKLTNKNIKSITGRSYRKDWKVRFGAEIIPERVNENGYVIACSWKTWYVYPKEGRYIHGKGLASTVSDAKDKIIVDSECYDWKWSDGL